jgi:ABC-2 type transport system permease protein
MFSSFTANQIIAFFAALATCLALWLLGKVLIFFPGSVTSVMEWIAFDTHLESMARGVVDTRNLVYFLSLTAFALMLAFRGLDSRRWR